MKTALAILASPRKEGNAALPLVGTQCQEILWRNTIEFFETLTEITGIRIAAQSSCVLYRRRLLQEQLLGLVHCLEEDTGPYYGSGK